MIAPVGNPPAQRDGLPGLLGAEFSGLMRADQREVLLFRMLGSGRFHPCEEAS